jgi:hypothetical protein
MDTAEIIKVPVSESPLSSDVLSQQVNQEVRAIGSEYTGHQSRPVGEQTPAQTGLTHEDHDVLNIPHDHPGEVPEEKMIEPAGTEIPFASVIKGKVIGVGDSKGWLNKLLGRMKKQSGGEVQSKAA